MNICFNSFLKFIPSQISNLRTFSGINVKPDPRLEWVLPLNNISSKIKTNLELYVLISNMRILLFV